MTLMDAVSRVVAASRDANPLWLRWADDVGCGRSLNVDHILQMVSRIRRDDPTRWTQLYGYYQRSIIPFSAVTFDRPQAVPADLHVELKEAFIGAVS